MRWILTALLLAGCGGSAFPDPVVDDCITEVNAGHHRFECDGMVHEVTVPPQCLSSACGLILDAHGSTMSAQQEENNMGLRPMGMQHGYVIYQPNANMLAEVNMTAWVPLQDDPKVMDFARRVVKAWHLDEDRIHVTGFSAGGFVALRLLCDHSDFFASAAPAGAGVLQVDEIDCLGPQEWVEIAIGEFWGCSFEGDQLPSPEIPILFMNGIHDNLNVYPCAAAQRDAIIAGWQMGNPQVVSEDAGHTWTRWTNSNGTVFEFIEHQYQADEPLLGGHCYPGSADTDPDNMPEGQFFPFGCADPDTFAWGQAVMDFFLAHPK